MKKHYTDRVKFLIDFNPSKNLKEQKLTKTDIKFIEDENTGDKYPNYCRYPEYTATPIKNKEGANESDALIEGYCYYRSGIRNSIQGGVGGIFIPKNAEIKFVTIRTIESNSKFISQKYGESERDLKIRLEKILPIGSVNKFYDDYGEEYSARIYHPEGYNDWVFKGFYKSDGVTPYVPPTWEDPRSKYAKFIDKWGELIQLSTFIATVILTPFTGGGSLALWLEFGVEMGIGVALGIRDFQKGQNISGFFSILQGMLPLLKRTKILTGISVNEIKELEEEIVRAGLNTNSSQSELINFYNKLSISKPHLQKTLTKIFDQDPYTKLKLSKGLSNILGNEIKGQIISELQIMFKSNPNMFKDLKVIEKLWVRELGLNGIFLGLDILSQISLGQKLDNDEKGKLSKIFAKIPESHHEDFYNSFALSIENIKEKLDSIETERFINTEKVTTEGMIEYQKYLRNENK